MTEWNTEERKALRGAGLSSWLGQTGETLSRVFYLLFLALMLIAEGSCIIVTVGLILAVLGVQMTWSAEDLVLALVASVIGWFICAFTTSALKQ